MPPESESTRASLPVGQLDELEQLVRAAPDLVARQPEEAPVDEQVLADVELEVEVVLLRDDAEPLPDRGAVALGSCRGRAACPRSAGDTAPIIRIVELLPAPFGPRKPNVSPRCDGEVDPVDGGEVAVALRQPVRLDHRLVGHAVTLAEAVRGDGAVNPHIVGGVRGWRRAGAPYRRGR